MVWLNISQEVVPAFTSVLLNSASVRYKDLEADTINEVSGERERERERESDKLSLAAQLQMALYKKSIKLVSTILQTVFPEFVCLSL